jgi:hypothetical protein
MKVDRIISIATLVASVTALVLVLKRPQPVVPAMSPAAVAANAQSFQNKMEQLEQAKAQGQPDTEVHLNAQEVTAAIAQASDAPEMMSTPASATTSDQAPSASGVDGLLSGDLGSGQPNIKDYQVNFEGDQVVGQFLTQVAGKDVWVTVKGHLGSKDGYATFDPSEFKVGDLNVPVSLVNDQLQKRLMEQRDRLKLPDSVGGLRVENGEVVLSNK